MVRPAVEAKREGVDPYVTDETKLVNQLVGTRQLPDRAEDWPLDWIGPTEDEVVNKFNLQDEQSMAFRIVYRVFMRELRSEEGIVPLRMVITGEAGTGKSYIIAAIVYVFAAYQMAHTLLITAPQGTAAAAHDGGRTMHSATGMNPLSMREEEERTHRIGSEKQRAFWEPIRFNLIEEISTCGANLLQRYSDGITQAMRGIRHADVSSSDAFGRLHMIFVGDPRQLPPVGDTALYCRPKNSISPSRGRNLWAERTHVVTLEKVYRQEGDPTFRGLLNRAKTGKSTTADVDLLNLRLHSRLKV